MSKRPTYNMGPSAEKPLTLDEILSKYPVQIEKTNSYYDRGGSRPRNAYFLIVTAPDRKYHFKVPLQTYHKVWTHLAKNGRLT